MDKELKKWNQDEVAFESFDKICVSNFRFSSVVSERQGKP